MKTKMNGNALTVFLEGHIDSLNSPQVEAEIMDIINKIKPQELTLDAENLKYISSSGLRIVLKLRKLYKALSIINVSPDVYEILSITGFTELVQVEKALRQFDIDGCEVVGRGAHGVVYRINRDTIIKVYQDATSLEDIKRERELSRTAFLMGVPTAIPYDVVRAGDKYGSVFELLDAKSFAELLREDAGKLDFVASETAKLAKTMHSTDAPDDLTKQRDVALGWVGMVDGYFAPEDHNKLKSLIEALPETGKMLHGDLHIKNIMLQKGEALLIDMDTLCTGHPIYELAFMYNAYKGFGIADKTEIEQFLGISAETAYSLWREILAMYLDTRNEELIDSTEAKAALIGHLRIMRRAIRMNLQNTPEGAAVISACKREIEEGLKKIDTLEF